LNLFDGKTFSKIVWIYLVVVFFSDCGEQTYNFLDIGTLTPMDDTSPGM